MLFLAVVVGGKIIFSKDVGKDLRKVDSAQQDHSNSFFQRNFYFPKLTGEYAVGMRKFHWVDEKRLETRVNDPQHPNRELLVQIWYPAQAEKDAYSPYAPEFMNFVKTQASWKEAFLTFMTQGFKTLYANYTNDAAPIKRQGGFPVIIFSHGYGCISDLYTALCSELASHGFIVAALNHTYDCCFVQFDSKRVAKAIPRKELLPDLVQNWSKDVNFVVKQLGALNKQQNNVFHANLDLNGIGICGHSFGGTTAINSCKTNQQIKAAVGLDCYFMRKLMEDWKSNAKKPIMVLRCQNFAESYCNSIMRREPTQRNETFDVIAADIHSMAQLAAFVDIKHNTEHSSFSDYAILKHASPLRGVLDWLKLDYLNLYTGINDGFQTTKIINDHVVKFFKKNL